MAKKRADGAKPKPRKLTVYLPAELIHGLKVIAAKEETSCSALVEQLAREIVKARAG
ncbi:MAG: ribbon-helix-helix protein, CopG family [Polyangia bacterium]